MREPDGLRVDGVSAGYGKRAVLHDVSLSVRPGEFVGLLGPNGSGKTTLVRVLSRTLHPWAGTVRVAGSDPYASGARDAARRLAVVPQELAPAFAYTVEEVIHMGRAPYVSAWGSGAAGDLEMVRDAARLARVEHLRRRPLDELSGGEKQRVVLAQALAQQAPVLLLDEPTTHLDLRHVSEMLATVRRLADEERRTVLAIFHDLNLATAYCDRLVVLSDGAVAADGTAQDVLTPDLLRDVYGVEATVAPNPVSGRPAVFLHTSG